MIVALLLLFSSMPLIAQRTAADGLYSTAQADRGRAVYVTACVNCHGTDLAGGVGGALKGEEFIRHWSGLPLTPLFERIRTMPPNTARPLAEGDALDVLAYVLSANGFPGGGELSTPVLETARVDEGSSEAAPNYSLVQSVGCLTRSGDGSWLITHATTPRRTKDPNSSQGDDRKRLAALPPGAEVFRAMNAYPSPDVLVGHRVEVRGLLIRGTPDRLNVTSLSSLSPECGS